MVSRVTITIYYLVSSSVLLELPLAIVEGADLARLEPARDTVEVESVVTRAPCYGAFPRGGCLIRLALDTEVHDVVATDGAVVNSKVP